MSLLIFFSTIIEKAFSSTIIASTLSKEVAKTATKSGKGIVKTLWNKCKKQWKPQVSANQEELYRAVREAYLLATRDMIDKLKLVPVYKFEIAENEKEEFESAFKKWIGAELSQLQGDNFPHEAQIQTKLETLVSGKRETTLEEIRVEIRLEAKNELWKELNDNLMVQLPDSLHKVLYGGWKENGKEKDWFDIMTDRFLDLLNQPQNNAALNIYQNILLADITNEIKNAAAQSEKRDHRMEGLLETILEYLPANHPVLETILAEINSLEETIRKNAVKLERIQERIDKYPEDKDFQKEQEEMIAEQSHVNDLLTKAYDKFYSFRDKISLLFRKIKETDDQQKKDEHDELVANIHRSLIENRLADISELVNLEIIEKRSAEYLAADQNGDHRERLALECLFAIIPLEQLNDIIHDNEIHKLYRISIRLHESFDNLYGYAGFLITCKEFLDAINYLVRATRFASPDPWVQVKLLDKLGDMYMLSHQHLEAKNTYRRALAILEELPADENNDNKLANYGINYGTLANNIANSCTKLKLFEQGEAWHLRSIAWLEHDNRLKTDDNRATELSDAYDGLGFTYIRMNKFDKAEEILTKSLAQRESLTEKNDGFRKLWRSLTNLATLYYYLKDYSKALEYFERSQKDLVQHVNLNPEKYEIELAMLYYNKGLLYREIQNWDAAKKEFENAWVILEKVSIRSQHYFDDTLGLIEIYTGEIEKKHHGFTAAEKKLLSAHDRFLRLYKADPESYERDLSMCFDSLGLFYRDTERADKAIQFMQKAYDLRKAMYEKNPSVFENLFALAAFNMGSILQTPKTLTEALSYYDESLIILTRLFADKPDMYRFDLVNVMINAGIGLADQGKTQLALEYLEEVLSIIAGAPEEKRKLFESYKALTLHHLGATYGILDEFVKALSHYSQAHVIYQQLIKDEPIIHNKHFGMTAHNMAVLLIQNGRFKEGENFCRQAIGLKDELLKINREANAQSMVFTLQVYATLLKVQQRLEEQYNVLFNGVVLCQDLIVIDHKAFADQFMNLLVELAITADVVGKMASITNFLEIGAAMIYKHKNLNGTYKYYFIILEKAWQAAGTNIHTVWEEIILPRMNGADDKSQNS